MVSIMDPNIQKNHQPIMSKRPRAKGLAGVLRPKGKTELSKNLEEKEILKCVADAWDEWKDASSCFEYASEEKLVDYYTYKMKACEARYSYFVGIAKERGLSVGMHEDKEQA